MVIFCTELDKLRISLVPVVCTWFLYACVCAWCVCMTCVCVCVWVCHDMNVEIIWQLVFTIHIFRTKFLSFFYSFQEFFISIFPFATRTLRLPMLVNLSLAFTRIVRVQTRVLIFLSQALYFLSHITNQISNFVTIKIAKVVNNSNNRFNAHKTIS